MLKLLFPGLMIAPVFALAVATGGESPFAGSHTTVTPATAVLASAPIGVDAVAETDACGSETFGIVFSHGLLESHSAEALGEAFASDADCEISFVRITSLVPEEDEVASVGVAKERAEVAAHIQALVGKERARSLRIHSDVQTTAYDNPHRYHALVRIERRPEGWVRVAKA